MGCARACQRPRQTSQLHIMPRMKAAWKVSPVLAAAKARAVMCDGAAGAAMMPDATTSDTSPSDPTMLPCLLGRGVSGARSARARNERRQAARRRRLGGALRESDRRARDSTQERTGYGNKPGKKRKVVLLGSGGGRFGPAWG